MSNPKSPYRQLQARAKARGIPANQSGAVLEALLAVPRPPYQTAPVQGPTAGPGGGGLLDRLDRLDKAATGVVQRQQLGALEYGLLPGAFFFGWIAPFTIYPLLWLLVGVDAFMFAFVVGGFTQIANRVLKMSFGRQRPDRLAAPPRTVYRDPLPSADAVGDGTVHGADEASFPSGDTGCAGFVAGTLIAAGYPPSAAALVLIYVATARVYWWYHWVGDTIAGGLVGLGCARLLDASVGYGNITVSHMAAIGVVFVVAMKGTSYVNKRVKRSQQSQPEHPKLKIKNSGIGSESK